LAVGRVADAAAAAAISAVSGAAAG